LCWFILIDYIMFDKNASITGTSLFSEDFQKNVAEY